MLKTAIHASSSADYKEKAKALRDELSALQLKMKEKSLPAIIVFEGWGASGKGTLIADTIKLLDPRFFKVISTVEATEAEKRYPRMKRYFENIPEYGKLCVMDRSWYRDLAAARIEEGISEKEYLRRVKSVNIFERQLTDDGYSLIYRRRSRKSAMTSLKRAARQAGVSPTRTGGKTSTMTATMTPLRK